MFLFWNRIERVVELIRLLNLMKWLRYLRYADYGLLKLYSKLFIDAYMQH